MEVKRSNEFAATERSKSASHGGPSGDIDDDLTHIDFSVSLNAFGPAAHVLSAIYNAAIDTYPDPTSRKVRDVASRYWNISPDNVLFGAGASELIHFTVNALVRANDSVVIPLPAFGEYQRTSALFSANIYTIPWMSDTLTIDINKTIDVIADVKPSLTFLCSPNNPTGQIVHTSDIARIADTCAQTGGILLIDQSYDAFAEHPAGTPVLHKHPNVLHLRSITKDHALAGIRAGFLVGSKKLLDIIDRVRIPWSTSTVAQAAATAALTSLGDTHLAATITKLRSEQKRILQRISQLGLKGPISGTHMQLINVTDATRVQQHLLRSYGIRVRDCSSFSLPNHIRVAARTQIENDEFIAAITEMVNNGHIPPSGSLC